MDTQHPLSQWLGYVWTCCEDTKSYCHFSQFLPRVCVPFLLLRVMRQAPVTIHNGGVGFSPTTMRSLWQLHFQAGWAPPRSYQVTQRLLPPPSLHRTQHPVYNTHHLPREVQPIGCTDPTACGKRLLVGTWNTSADTPSSSQHQGNEGNTVPRLSPEEEWGLPRLQAPPHSPLWDLQIVSSTYFWLFCICFITGREHKLYRRGGVKSIF